MRPAWAWRAPELKSAAQVPAGPAHGGRKWEGRERGAGGGCSGRCRRGPARPGRGAGAPWPTASLGSDHGAGAKAVLGADRRGRRRKGGRAARTRSRAAALLRGSGRLGVTDTSRAQWQLRKKRRKKERTKRRGSSSSDDSSDSDSKTKKSRHSKKKRAKEKDKKKKKKRIKKKSKKKSKEKAKEEKAKGESVPGPSLEQWQKESLVDSGPDEQKSRIQAMKPMTKEEWDARQSVIRRVVDPETGRTRLIKGDGEVLEEIVSKERHKEINKQATRGDGLAFQARTGMLQ
ncbi:ADP-ribosylation factor-like protein 6-interacting protein 4 isoform X4 [Strigops habroptila]|uniref:ADP-ribosylation factor-like protein 6-interacting protein 4 isoform X4 n=1 Tax=Strigops habroptila TaxID=2489341 RepID=UPI0011CF49FC|nr:ADP-ribosylation factor-like protein 6-interacting protein 4 isoform X4 [Strigops habroptila]